MGVAIVIGWVLSAFTLLAIVGIVSRNYHKKRLWLTSKFIIGSILSLITAAIIIIFFDHLIPDNTYILALARTSLIAYVVFSFGVFLCCLVEWFISKRLKTD